MSPKSARAARLMSLYELRQKVVAEIADLEAAIQREANEAARLSAQFDAWNRAHRKRRSIAECGTDGGYHHHRRQLKEDACAACKMAHSAAERARQARKAAS